MFLKTPTHEEAEEETTPNAESLGAYLKSARLGQGLELDAIASETRINGKSLAALEENNRAALPADVFCRGFTKIYAAYLKLDPQEALRLYDKQWGAERHFTDSLLAVKPARLVRPGITTSLLLIALFFAVRFYYPNSELPLSQQGNLPSTLPETKSSAEGAPAPANGEVNRDQTAATPPAPEGKTAGELAADPTEQTEPPPADTATPSPADQAAVPPYEIRLQAGKQTSIKLSLDEGKPIEKTIPAGDSQTWQASTGFDLTISSADGANLTINGAEVPINTEAGSTVTIHRP